jgi:hypothetical protein
MFYITVHHNGISEPSKQNSFNITINAVHVAAVAAYMQDKLHRCHLNYVVVT